MPLDDAEARLAAQEAELVAQIADGNIEEPMKELYHRYVKNLYRFGLHMLGDAGLAEEMVQETFQRLWRGVGRYDARRGTVGAFVFVIARSAAADIRKRPSSRPLLQAEDYQLSSPHAEVLRLVLDESLTQVEIAERLGLAVGTVKSRTFNGMRALRSALGERGIHAA
jgi:RNA polymerase sigma-70 factor (ECF subfamily)